MPAGTFTNGNITVSGFVADGGGSFAPVMTFLDSVANGGTGPDDDFVFRWTGADADGNGTGEQVAVTDGGSGDTWSLTVSIVDLNGQALGGEELYAGSTSLTAALTGGNAGEVNSSSLQTGTGAASLAAFIRSLHVDTPGGGAGFLANVYDIRFSLVDTTIDPGSTSPTVWQEHFVTSSTPCYLVGTRVAVPGGEVAIENLRVGDLVMTASGAAKPVKWLGQRSYTAAAAAANPHVRSVLVRKDAIAPGMPHRDLSVSPMHALFINDAFVPAASLANGVTILRNDDLAPVTYIHVEMDSHDVIFAEGLPAETFVDDASRQMFDNADEYYALYGADQGKVGFSAPRIEEGLQLETLRRRIAARAGLPTPVASTGKLKGHVERLEDGVLHGWVLDTANTSAPVELEILADGELVATAIANRYRADLDFHGLAGGRAGFTVALPASVTSLAQVSVRRSTDRARVAMPQTALVD